MSRMPDFFLSFVLNAGKDMKFMLLPAVTYLSLYMCPAVPFVVFKINKNKQTSNTLIAFVLHEAVY